MAQSKRHTYGRVSWGEGNLFTNSWLCRETLFCAVALAVAAELRLVLCWVWGWVSLHPQHYPLSCAVGGWICLSDGGGCVLLI